MGEPRMANAECRWECPEQWSEWSQWLAAGLHARNRWRLPVLMVGMSVCRRTAHRDHLAAGRRRQRRLPRLLLLPGGPRTQDQIDCDPVGSDCCRDLAAAGAPAGGDRRFAHQAVRPEGRRAPTFITIRRRARPTKRFCMDTSGSRSRWPCGIPAGAPWRCRCGPCCTSASKPWPRFPSCRGWPRFATKLQLAARLVEWIVPLLKKAGKIVWIVVDGGYIKRPFLRRVLQLSKVVVVGRLRKDAHLRDLPPKLKPGQRRGRGRPRKYGKNRISLAKRAGQGRGWQTARMHGLWRSGYQNLQDLPGDLRSGGGVIRVVLVKEDHGWYAFFSTDPTASVRDILEAFADRATIEQDFHDVKEVWGSGQQQVRNIWTNLAVYNLNLWMHTLVELWAWNRSRTAIGRPQRLAVGRCRPTPFPRQPSQSLTPTDPPQRIIEHHHRLVAYHEKSSNWPKASWPWPPNVVLFSESADRPYRA